jgi:hypothetical protein
MSSGIGFVAIESEGINGSEDDVDVAGFRPEDLLTGLSSGTIAAR